MTTPVDLPQYLNYDDEATERRYQELLNLILTQWFNSNGFFQPTLTNAQVTAILAMTPAPLVGTHWYNSDLDKMQFIGAGNVAQTITSV
jgi:hypothetical protein